MKKCEENLKPELFVINKKVPFHYSFTKFLYEAGKKYKNTKQPFSIFLVDEVFFIILFFQKKKKSFVIIVIN